MINWITAANIVVPLLIVIGRHWFGETAAPLIDIAHFVLISSGLFALDWLRGRIGFLRRAKG